MNEKDLIKKLQGLKEIQPNKDWAISLKAQIVGEQRKATIFEVLPQMFLQRKLAYATISVFAVVLGVVSFAQYTVPGDLLFSVKKATEQSQGALLVGANQSGYNLDIAKRRMEELAVVIKDNKKANIAPAIREAQDSIAQVIKDTPNNASDFTSIAARVQEIQQAKREAETLGVVIVEESDQLNSALAPLVENEIKALDQSTSLDENQLVALEEIKANYEKGEYTAALEQILLITNSK